MLFWLIIWPVLSAVVLYLLNTRYVKEMIILLQVIFFSVVCGVFYQVKVGGTIVMTIGDYPVGLGVGLYADLITMSLVTLTVFLFTLMLIFIYRKNYMNRLFMFLFMILQGLMNGIFLSNDLFNLYVLIEVSTIVVSILIMFKKDSQSIYDGMIYLLVNIVAMTFFLIGVGYMYKLFGVLDLRIISQKVKEIPENQLILPYAFLMTAVGLKAAIMPLFSWLPRAHGTPSAPSAVSAILSGLYVKGGVYLLIRLQDIFNQVLHVDALFIIMGLLTGVIGFILALAQTDIKLILAYHTVSQIGLIVFGLSLGDELSYMGSVYHILNHAVFKSTLFLTAGMIIDHYGTRDIRKIRGVAKELPFVGIITLMAFLGITGAPFFNGSVSKYLIGKGAKDSIYEYGLLLMNLGTIMSFVKYMSMFFGQGVKKAKLPLNQKLPVIILGVTCLLGGVFAGPALEFLFNEPVYISPKGYALKGVYYIVFIVIGVLFYKYCYSRIKVLKKIRGLELTFNEIVYTIVAFFSLMVFYLYAIEGFI